MNEPHGSDDENYDDIINYLPFFVLLLLLLFFYFIYFLFVFFGNGELFISVGGLCEAV